MKMTYSMIFDARRLILNLFIALLLPCAATVWMFHKGKLNERIDNIYQRALKLVCKDYKLFFQTSLREDHP